MSEAIAAPAGADEPLSITGPAGRIEGRYQPAKQKGAPIGIVLHPHPQFGGTMNNQIVYNLFYGFVNRGFSALRFNFRGVGRSQGAFDHGAGELSDAAARPQLLSELADLTGGAVFELPRTSLPRLPLQEPEVVEVGARKDKPIWDAWPILLVLVAAAGAEWALRRRWGHL